MLAFLFWHKPLPANIYRMRCDRLWYRNRCKWPSNGNTNSLICSLSRATLVNISSFPIMASLVSRSFVASSIFIISGVWAGPPVTCSNPQLSCQNTTIVSDLCCFNAPGGQLLQPQFWDTCKPWKPTIILLAHLLAPSTGPPDSWTIHGLWYGVSCNKNE
jgi:ribonuclease T2